MGESEGDPSPALTLSSSPGHYVEELQIVTFQGTVSNANGMFYNGGADWVELQANLDTVQGNLQITGYYADDNVTATPADARTFQVWAIDGSETTSLTSPLTVGNVPPAAIVTVPDEVTEGQSAKVSVKVNDAFNAFASTRDTFTIVVDWGDGSSETRNVVFTTPYPYPYPTYVDPNTHNFFHVFVDDNPTATPKDEYTVAVTVIDDDTGVHQEASDIRVKNVAPTISVDPLSEVINENGMVSVSGRVHDVGLLDAITVLVELDLNFDGDTEDDDEMYLIFVPPNGYETRLFGPVTFQVPDDGANYDTDGVRIWGNGTHQDPLAIAVTVKDDDQGGNGECVVVMIENVAPFFDDSDEAEGYPKVDFEFDTDGVLLQKMRVTGAFIDPGVEDLHIVDVTWGDGQTTSVTLPKGERFFTVERSFNPPGKPDFSGMFPIIVELLDDDAGIDSYTKSFACSDLDETAVSIEGIEFLGGRGSFQNVEVVTHDQSDGYVGVEFGMFWNADKRAFFGKGVCQIGIVQVARTEAHYWGVLGEIIEQTQNGEWHVDSNVPYPNEWFETHPVADNPFSDGRLSAQDNPGLVVSAYGGGTWLQHGEQDFETCIVALSGHEGLEVEMVAPTLSTGIDKMAVYGCIKWGYRAVLQNDGTYVVTKKLMGQSAVDDYRLTYEDHGLGPSQTFLDTLDAHYVYVGPI